MRLYVGCHAIEMKPNLTYNPKPSIHLNHLRLYCQHLKKLNPRQDKFFWLLLTSLELGEAPGGGVFPYISYIGMCHPIG